MTQRPCPRNPVIPYFLLGLFYCVVRSWPGPLRRRLLRRLLSLRSEHWDQIVRGSALFSRPPSSSCLGFLFSHRVVSDIHQHIVIILVVPDTHTASNVLRWRRVLPDLSDNITGAEVYRQIVLNCIVSNPLLLGVLDHLLPRNLLIFKLFVLSLQKSIGSTQLAFRLFLWLALSDKFVLPLLPVEPLQGLAFNFKVLSNFPYLGQMTIIHWWSWLRLPGAFSQHLQGPLRRLLPFSSRWLLLFG